MRIVLISPYTDITVFGLRTISAYLKEAGHKTRMIFLPDKYGDHPEYGKERYGMDVMTELVELCEDADLIGISLMTNFFFSAVEITDALKRRLNTKVIWGGVHPTICPEECIEFADIVCIGDGEGAILELADKIEKGGALGRIENLWYREGTETIKCGVRRLAQDLDALPIPDYSRDDHYILINKHIRPLDARRTKLLLENGTVSRYVKKTGYQTMTGRGCPHRCSYCINDAIKQLYKGEKYLRWRSNAHVMRELLWVKMNMPYVEFIWISDDSFFSRRLESIREFAREYKKTIGLPFSCLASPLTISEEKMEVLIDAGLFYLQMGIETGSQKIQKLFNRSSMSNSRMKKAISIVNRYRDRMIPPSYDFIMDVPYETDEDKIETLKFISNIPKPFRLQPFSLVIYPGTELYKKAKMDGYITDERKQIYFKSYDMREPGYLGLLVSVAKYGKIPSFLLRCLISRPAVLILNGRLMKPVFKDLFILSKRFWRSIRRMGNRS